MNPSRTPVTAFRKHDRIVATATTQGMTTGHRYTVTDLVITPLPFGTFVRYQLRPDGGGEPLWAANPHLLARRAGAA